VPDATRSVQLPDVLPVVINRLSSGGVPRSAITVLVANGTHPLIGSTNLERLVGTLPAGVQAVEHDSRNGEALVGVGTTSTGLEVRLNRLVVQSDVVVSVGAVKHHYFAGFGGGPKMIFPGTAGYEEIQVNHSKVLAEIDGQTRRQPGCEPGQLAANPVAEEIAEAADLHPVHLSVCLAPGNDGGVAWAVAGGWRTAFGSCVEKVREWYETSVPERSTLVVASGGGSPGDQTLIQAHKGLDAACRLAVTGGEVLFFAELAGGPGSPDMAPFITEPSPESILSRLRGGWVQYGHTTLRLVEKTSAYRVHLYSSLDRELACRLGFRPVEDPAEVVERWRERHPGETVTVLPGAPVYPKSR
jgi:nickel-dependent lactate racemase